MHDCSPIGALFCSNCFSFWCYKCAYHKYFTDIGEPITSPVSCTNCKKPFNLLEMRKLISVRHWGYILWKRPGEHIFDRLGLFNQQKSSLRSQSFFVSRSLRRSCLCQRAHFGIEYILRFHNLISQLFTRIIGHFYFY